MLYKGNFCDLFAEIAVIEEIAHTNQNLIILWVVELFEAARYIIMIYHGQMHKYFRILFACIVQCYYCAIYASDYDFTICICHL